MKSGRGENSIGGVTTQCRGCNRNGLIQSPEMQLHAGQKWIKIGKLHSQNALLKREQEWQKNWSFLVQYSAGALDELSSDDNHEAVLSEHNSSLSQASVHGFKKDECTMSLNMYHMLMDQICYLEAEEDLSTDEDEIENLVPKHCREKRPQSSHTASDDTALPDLLLPDLNPKQLVLHQTPPYLSPGYTFNPAGIEVKHRPYVLLEKLNKDLDAALLADPQKRVTVTTIPQSRVLRKRGNNEKAALLNKKKATVGGNCVTKRASKEKDKVTDGCAVNRHIHRSSKYPENVTVKLICKDLPVTLPVKRKHKSHRSFHN